MASLQSHGLNCDTHWPRSAARFVRFGTMQRATHEVSEEMNYSTGKWYQAERWRFDFSRTQLEIPQ